MPLRRLTTILCWAIELLLYCNVGGTIFARRSWSYCAILATDNWAVYDLG